MILDGAEWPVLVIVCYYCVFPYSMLIFADACMSQGGGMDVMFFLPVAC